MINDYSRLSTDHLIYAPPLLPFSSFIIGVLWKLAWHWARLSNALESFFWLLSLFYLNLKPTMLAWGFYPPGAIRRLKFCSTCLSAAPRVPLFTSSAAQGHATCHTGHSLPPRAGVTSGGGLPNHKPFCLQCTWFSSPALQRALAESD